MSIGAVGWDARLVSSGRGEGQISCTCCLDQGGLVCSDRQPIASCRADRCHSSEASKPSKYVNLIITAAKRSRHRVRQPGHARANPAVIKHARYCRAAACCAD
jgi:hypothetical protein